MRKKREPVDALGRPIEPGTLYRALIDFFSDAYEGGFVICHRDSRFRGDHAAVMAVPGYFVPAAEADDVVRAAREALMPPTPTVEDPHAAQIVGARTWADVAEKEGVVHMHLPQIPVPSRRLG